LKHVGPHLLAAPALVTILWIIVILPGQRATEDKNLEKDE
jgi:hypothetical protein